ncbi:RecQ family ATP-dependent DNA helicase [Dyadobacter chenhuakuii]|uniref:ATP-dependent DNA helicase RecQ n=1 Tax=Dyadobacter chenhuakuii TaxID=2909339 RepID=A0ABY4XHJ1_9BACT|nr:ATP-dependent DNA helicase RecQ [Dyadobacter chenhuakuii]MCF2496647.1 RecQ family ATP-dependent DNA helicase [Dyadobacter chenhuakuii]USJ29901.1 RecQ family ATP-dependent DNA helicase [Dyadobacter chenhuakuii]
MTDLHAILKQYWGYDTFRPFQEDAIKTVLNGIDTLVLLPTGGGKSVCFQVPVLAMEGVCIVVTPLIALMKDQVEQLKRRSIFAAAIHSGMSKNEIDITLDNCIHGNTKFLYVSPERLRTDIMVARVKQMNVCLLAIDEAHCISAWGYDFRPAYLLISDFRKIIAGVPSPAGKRQDVPLMALTATATEEVRADILEKLEMRNARVFKQSFARANLSYSAFSEENKERKLLQILKNVAGTAIVYVRTRKRTKELADWLNRQGISAQNYHAGLPFRERSDRQTAWIKNQVRVVVATNAFGMGIDKPDVRAVVHFDLPDNLEAYYQEAGRAGRDEQKAYAVALFTKIDLEELSESVERKYPPIEVLKRVYQALANYYKLAVGGGEFASFDFDIQEFTGVFGLAVNETHYALKLLEEEGFLQLSESFNDASKIHFLVDNRQLYDFQIRYQEMDSFIKVILRMYGGELFTEYVRISENELGQVYFAPENEVVKKLKFMHEREIIDYEPRKSKPQLTFLTPRYDATLLPLNVFEINKKKERDIKKARAVAHYASHTRICRTLLLLEYFNEFDAEACGVCDICIQNKKNELAQNPGLETTLTNFLAQNGPVTPNELGIAFEDIPEKDFLQTLQQLIKEETIRYDDAGKLSLTNKTQH